MCLCFLEEGRQGTSCATTVRGGGQELVGWLQGWAAELPHIEVRGLISTCHGLAGSYRSLTFSLFYNMKVTHLIKE